MIWKRLKNLWKISEYGLSKVPTWQSKIGEEQKEVMVLSKNIVTVKKQLAKIVNIPEEPFFSPNEIKEV